jgi:rhodanese-related sulfurtransferase
MFKNISSALIILLISAFVLAGCQSAKEPGAEIKTDAGSYRLISATELQTMLENKDFVMVNVHIPWQGNIPQTDLRLAYDQIEQNLAQLPQEKDARILVYCLTSGMAKKAVGTLLSQGYTNLWMLDGGTTSWEEAGLALEK